MVNEYIIYDQRTQNSLIQEQYKEEHPDVDDIVQRVRLLTPKQQANLFLNICKRYGKKGWNIPGLPYQTADGTRYYLLRKRKYKSEAGRPRE